MVCFRLPKLLFLPTMSILVLLCCCSFSRLPIPQLPATHKKEYRAQKKVQRLKRYLAKAKRPKRQQQLKKRLLQLQQQNPPSSLLAIFCFAAGLLGFILLLFVAVAYGIFGGTVELSVLIVFFIVFSVVALVLGIIYYNKCYQDKAAHPQPALATLGIILGGLSFLVGTILLLTALVNLPLV
jgi:hypothetical protein